MELARQCHDVSTTRGSEWVRSFFLLLAVLLATITAAAQAQAPAGDSKPAERAKYWIEFKINLDRLSYTGYERVKWINRGEKPSSVLYVHLDPNLRVNDPDNAASANPAADEPTLEITEVRSEEGDAPLYYFLDDQGTTLRINLREPVSPGDSTEVDIK